MKRLLSIAILAIAVVAITPQLSTAQSGYFQSSGNKLDKSADTIVNAGTVNITLPVTGYQKVLTIQPIATKLSGTPAGTVVLYAATKAGLPFVPCPSRRQDGTYKLDTLSLTNVSIAQSKGFVVENSPYSVYQLRAVGSGTQSTRLQGFAIWRKE